MGSNSGVNVGDLWSQIISEDKEQQGGEEEERPRNVEVIYQRRNPQKNHKDENLSRKLDLVDKRTSFVVTKQRVSWNRSLSTRGRASIAVFARVDNEPQLKRAPRKGKPTIPKGKVVQPPNFEKEREYFQEVDAFNLLEESPSPKKTGVWTTENQIDGIPFSKLSSRLEAWLVAKKLNYPCGTSSSLSKILETTAVHGHDSGASSREAREAIIRQSNLLDSKLLSTSVGDDGHEDLGDAVRKLSLASSISSDLDYKDQFASLLKVCEQPAPSKLIDVFSKFCDPKHITKVGEGTFGEAFKAGACVCKIVPIDGNLKVNGEEQKRSEELLGEVVLCQTLNRLRCDDGLYNACSTFIETLDLKVCQGRYDPFLIKAWEDWDEEHNSENDHPKQFPENQNYVVFVLQHGGKDLESFVLLNFDEARSLLVQVTAALAVAESAFQFEHRDLHWGNILLSRNETASLKFVLDGKHIILKTFGLLISIIDFTLSRINTGEDILFLDLSTDPDLFKGPKGDKQSETYRKMKVVTKDFWEGSFSRTNVLWLIYVVDILLLRKSFERSSKDERDLRSLKKRLETYQSAKEAISDPFFTDLFIHEV